MINGYASYSHWGMYPIPFEEQLGWDDTRIYNYDSKYLHG